jgi:hypothetical protein
MANMTAEQIAAMAKKLAELAAVFSPANAAAILALLEIGAEFNHMIADIKQQTKANEAEVWEQVRSHSAGALIAFKRSVERNNEGEGL